VHEGGFTVAREETTDGLRLVHHRPDGVEIPDPEPVVRRAVTQLTFDTQPPGTRAGPFGSGVPRPWAS
nr:hypothetical protein [Actinomycetota bacterium]